jgi:hypothetical protein
MKCLTVIINWIKHKTALFLHCLTNKNNFCVIFFMSVQQTTVDTDFPLSTRLNVQFFVFLTCEHSRRTFTVMVIFHVIKSLSIIITYTPT